MIGSIGCREQYQCSAPSRFGIKVRFVADTLPAASLAVTVMMLAPGFNGRSSSQNVPLRSTTAADDICHAIGIHQLRRYLSRLVIQNTAQRKVCSADSRFVLWPNHRNDRWIGVARKIQSNGYVCCSYVAGQIGGSNGDGVDSICQFNVKALKPVCCGIQMCWYQNIVPSRNLVGRSCCQPHWSRRNKCWKAVPCRSLEPG